MSIRSSVFSVALVTVAVLSSPSPLVLAAHAGASVDHSIANRSLQFERVQIQMLERGSNQHAIAVATRRAYRELLSPFQTRSRLANLSAADITLLFRAASQVAANTEDARYVRDMQLDLNALRERGQASQPLYIELNEALIGSRMFSQARMLERAHPGTAVEVFHGSQGDRSERVEMVSVPEFRDDTSGRAGPTEMRVSANGRLLARRAIVANAPAQIIVVISPLCHFAQVGIRDIEGDPQLRAVFHDHAIWLVPPFVTEFDAIAEWNSTHPDEPMALAYNFQDWSMLDEWDTPTFYFLRRGTVVGKVVGWPREGRKLEIRFALKRIGLL